MKASGANPFYELVFCTSQSRVGKALGDYRSFEFPDSMPCWQEEFIGVKGGDLEYMPSFQEKVECSYKVDRSSLSDTKIKVLVGLVRALGKKWDVTNFFSSADL